MWNLKFDTYQDVRNILHRYTYAVSIIISILAYFLIIHDDHKVVLNTIFGYITDYVPVGIVISILFGFIISFLFIQMFEVYDKIYDRFIIRWRYRYSRDFIFPELFKPFETKLNEQFLATAVKNMREFMNIYYYFVGDRDMKIRKNAVVRFYETIWKYWTTQINEILFILFTLMIIAYVIYYAINDLPLFSLVTPSIAIVVLLILNRMIRFYFLKNVKIATQEEIEEIHRDFLDELEDKTKEISGNFGLSYGSD